MAILTDTAMGRLGSWIERNLLKDEATIWRNFPTRSPSGGQVDHWTAQHTGVPCAVLGSGSPSESAQAGQTVGIIGKTIMLPRGQDVLGNDKIQVGAVIYHVIDLFEPGTFTVCSRVLVQRSSLPSGR